MRPKREDAYATALTYIGGGKGRIEETFEIAGTSVEILAVSNILHFPVLFCCCFVEFPILPPLLSFVWHGRYAPNGRRLIRQLPFVFHIRQTNYDNRYRYESMLKENLKIIIK